MMMTHEDDGEGVEDIDGIMRRVRGHNGEEQRWACAFSWLGKGAAPSTESNIKTDGNTQQWKQQTYTMAYTPTRHG